MTRNYGQSVGSRRREELRLNISCVLFEKFLNMNAFRNGLLYPIGGRHLKVHRNIDYQMPKKQQNYENETKRIWRDNINRIVVIRADILCKV